MEKKKKKEKRRSESWGVSRNWLEYLEMGWRVEANRSLSSSYKVEDLDSEKVDLRQRRGVSYASSFGEASPPYRSSNTPAFMAG